MAASFAPTTAEAAASDLSDDGALGQRLRLFQPRTGHRFGHDAILLAAATDAVPGQHAVDFGAGIGAAGLALAYRVPDLRVNLVELDPALCAIARSNAQRNALDHRVDVFCLDIKDDEGFRAANLTSAERVLMNPPFNNPARHQSSPIAPKRRAHTGAEHTLLLWAASAANLLGGDGVLTLIWRADGLATVRSALEGQFGNIAVRPILPKPNADPIRILVRAVKGSRAPDQSLPALTLANSQGKPTPIAEEILREGHPISMI